MTSEEDAKLLEYVKSLGIPPMKDLDEFKQFMTSYGKEQTTSKRDSPPDTQKVKTQINNPRISIFFGEDGKGEVAYDTWAYEVKCLLLEKIHPEEILLQSVRRSLRGHAADQLRHIGLGATIPQILSHFESTYGLIETTESILRKFYACQQNIGESVVNYSNRIENIHAKAIELNALSNGDKMLKSVFYRGLTPQLKHLCAFKFEICADYLSFKREVRQIENELIEDTSTSTNEKTKPCSAINKKEEKKEQTNEKQLNEITSLLEKLNARIEILENGQKESTEQTLTNFQQQPQFGFPQQNTFRPIYRGRGQGQNRGRGNQTRGQGPNRGQNNYNFQRPPCFLQCYNCGGMGHLARDCPSTPQGQQRQCYKCNEVGHIAKNCPTN